MSFKQRDFADINFAESYLLRFRQSKREISFRAEWALEPSHPLFTAAKPSERACWHAGELKVSGFSSAVWEWLDIDPALDANNSVDLGNFAIGVVERDHLLVGGDWGSVRINKPGDFVLEIGDKID
jgi:hypothetical protein